MDNISIKTPIVAPAELPRKKRKYTKSADGKPKALGPYVDQKLLAEFNRQLEELNASDIYPFAVKQKEFIYHLLRVNAKHMRRVI
jgi:hypothetical protein